MSYKNMEEHTFFCINCGQKNVPLFRNRGFRHKKHHRKKLYCPFCKTEVNHIECKDYEEIEDFLEKFKNGEYQNEAKESLSFLRSACIG